MDIILQLSPNAHLIYSSVSKGAYRMANSVDPDQTVRSRMCLVWVHTVGSCLSVPILEVIVVSNE